MLLKRKKKERKARLLPQRSASNTESVTENIYDKGFDLSVHPINTKHCYILRMCMPTHIMTLTNVSNCILKVIDLVKLQTHFS